MSIPIFNKKKKKEPDYIGDALLICKECHNKVPINYCPLCGSTKLKKVIKYHPHVLKKIECLEEKLNNKNFLADKIVKEVIKRA